MISNDLHIARIRVLIISDRLIDQAKELSNYLNSVGIHVIGLVQTKEQALELADQAIDFLIVAGYLKNQQNYEIISEYRKRNKTFIALHWAMLDSLIYGYCAKYKIPLKFERTSPMSDFAAYLHKHCPVPTVTPDKINRKVPDKNEF
ncbi:hypothetical protein EDD66_11289 [Mobilisporobacter senegalensis]|uniref:Response regulatory domain-containing protein n=1 Tax=Mobilisporobacter senegalensis TaxID=1329262 RepID=A0A3N1XD34_9FIRM|nr:hypothetical protein [Mobilisporobacter senegalensis]ROR23958.1 hypothetical protein EDD66_11289 [Mobilisporobacter senegalensis]